MLGEFRVRLLVNPSEPDFVNLSWGQTREMIFRIVGQTKQEVGN